MVGAVPDEPRPTDLDEHDDPRTLASLMIAATQALLGLITDNNFAIGVEFDSSSARLVYWVKVPGEAAREEADDVTSELEALWWPSSPPVADPRINVGFPEGPFWGRRHALVYLYHSPRMEE